MLKYFIIVLFITTSLAQPLNNKNKQPNNLKPNTVEIWENETKKIKDPELKKELMKLNVEFKNKRKNIHDDFKLKIKPLKIQKDNNISILKDNYLNKRKLLFKKYGVKIDSELKKNNKDSIGNKKHLPYYKKHNPILKNNQEK